MNKVILIGRLGHDASVKAVNEKQVANFSLATSERWRDKNGQNQQKTEWHRIVVWGKQAEIAGQYLKKGALVALEGRIESRKWTDKQGQERSVTEIICSSFHMLDKPTDKPQPENGGSEVSDDDIPF